MFCWDVEKVLSLIDEYHKRPILWRKNDILYNNLPAKESAWDDISEIFGIDKDSLKKKIESLRASRRREKNRMRNGKGRKIYVSKWFAWKPLQFLEESEELRSRAYSVHKPLRNNDVEKDNTVERDHPERCDSPDEPNSKPKKKRKADFFIQEAFNILRGKTNNEKKDECAMFGDYIGEKLRKLDYGIRVTLQNQIHNLIYEAEVGRTPIAIATQIPSTSQTIDIVAESNSFSSRESSPSSAVSDSFAPETFEATCEQKENWKVNHTGSKMLNNKVT